MAKTHVTTIFFVALSIFVRAQGISITSGGNIVVVGSPYILINNGSLLNNGSYNKDAETLSFTGSVAGTISGSNTGVNHLVISNTSGITASLNLLTAQTLDISSSCKLTVAAAKALTVNGTITNNGGTGGLILKSTAEGTASLLHGTSNVPATVERYIPSSAESWHFVGTPVVAQNITGDWVPSGTYGNGTGYDLYVWNEPSSCWIYKLNTTATVNWNTVHPESFFVPVRGYLYAFQATNPTKTFTGNLNSGSASTSLSFSSTNGTLKGFNFVGNPYPSSIDWKASSGWSRSNLVSSGGGYNVWIWNPAVSNYGVYNSADDDSLGTNSVTQYIASTQGFFVQAAATGTFAMDNSVRIHNRAGNLFKDKVQKYNAVSLGVKSENGFGADEVMLRFGFSANDDGAMKLFSRVPTAPNLFMSNKSNSYSVRYFTSTSDNSSVPIMFTAGASGSYTISSSYDMFQFCILLLEDKQLKRIHDMKTGPYSFTATKSDPANRFVLHFEPIQPTPPVVDLNPIVYAKNEQLVVDLSAIHQETTVYVYDLMGRLMLQGKLQGDNLHRLSLNSPQQVLVVKLVNAEKNYSQKVMWVKE